MTPDDTAWHERPDTDALIAAMDDQLRRLHAAAVAGQLDATPTMIARIEGGMAVLAALAGDDPAAIAARILGEDDDGA